MTFEQLKAHVGGLICLKTPLRWIAYNHWSDSYWDNSEDRIYALIDVESNTNNPGQKPEACGLHVSLQDYNSETVVRLHLLIEGVQRHVWVLRCDVELFE
jgi:hypothetical protein